MRGLPATIAVARTGLDKARAIQIGHAPAATTAFCDLSSEAGPLPSLDHAAAVSTDGSCSNGVRRGCVERGTRGLISTAR